MAVFVLAPAAGLGVLVARFDPNDYKPMLIDAAEHATGRRLAVKGGITLSRSLWPVVEATDVFLANLPGGSRPHMAHAERIAVQVSLPALLRRRIVVTKLTLIGPDILFEQVKGVPNWRFDLPDGDDDAPAPANPYALLIKAAHVQNGMVTWRLPARTKVLGLRTLDVQHPTERGPVDAQGTLVYADNQPFNLTLSAQPTAGLGGPWTTRLGFDAFDTTATANGTMDTAGNYDLQLDARSGTVERLNALLPEMGLPAIHQATLATRLINGKQPGDLPTLGATKLHWAEADFGSQGPSLVPGAKPGAGPVPGLTFGAFDLAIDKPGGTATLSGTGRYAAQGFSLTGTTGVPLHPDGRISLPIDLTVKSASNAPAFTLNLKGKLALRTLVYDGLDATAALTTPALAALRPLLSPALPALTGVSFGGHVVLPADAASIAVSAGRLASRQGDLSGDATMRLDGGTAVTAKLRAASLDLDAMLEAFGIDLAPRAQRRPARPMISDAPLDWSVLRGPALDVSLGADRLRFLEQPWQGVEAKVQLKGGRLQQAALKLETTGGPVSLGLTADANTAAVPVTVSLDAPALPLALVARYAGLPGQVSGAARVQARLHGSGPSLHDLAASLDGTASLASVGGRMDNAAFIALTGTSLAPLGIKVPAQGQTALRCLGVSASFQRGVGQLSPIALETTYLSLGGAGTVDLRQERLALALKPLATVSGSAVEVPVVVEGPFDAIAGRLDANLFDKVGLLVDALFGGDEATACADAGLVPPKLQ